MSTSPTLFRHQAASALNLSLVVAILLILFGILAVIAPEISGLAVTVVVGWLFTLTGVLHFVFAWRTHSTSGVLWELLLGFVYVVAGVYLIAHPIAGLATLTLMLAAYMLVKGLFELFQFFQLRPRHGSGWLLADSIISVILAILIWRSWPSSSVWAIGTLIGLGMLFAGVSRLMLTLTVRRALDAGTTRDVIAP